MNHSSKMILLTLIGACLAFWAPTGCEGACPTIFNNGVCPLAIAEDAPVLALKTTCAGRGSCVRGVCQCIAGWSNEDCSRKERRLLLGSMAISQNALKEAPTRYSDIVTNTFNRVKEQNLELPPFDQTNCTYFILRTPLIPNSGITLTLDQSSIKVDIKNDGVQVAAVFNAAIPYIPVDAYVSVNPGNAVTGTCCTAQNVSLYQETSTCTKACASNTGDRASVQFTIAIGARVIPFINATTGQLQASAPSNQVTVDLLPDDLNFELQCSLSQYPLLLFNLYNNYVQPWGVLIANEVTTAIADEVQNQASRFAEATATFLNATNGTSVQVVATALQFVENSFIRVSMEALVRKNRFYKDQPLGCPPMYTSFVDADPDALLPVPNDFDVETDELATNNIVMKPLVAVRISRSALRALMWSALLDEPEAIASLTTYTRAYTLLDANYRASFEWKLPKFSFPYVAAANGSLPVNNTIRFVAGFGTSDLICNNTGLSQLTTTYGLISADLKPVAYGNLSQPSGAVFGLTGELMTWDASRINMNISAPQKLCMPNALLAALAEKFMVGKVETANAVLRERSIIIPPSLVRYLPGPRMEAFHDFDNEGSDSENGYIDATTRCACVSNTNAPYVSVPTSRFGIEYMPRCLFSCSPPSGRLLDATTEEMDKTAQLNLEVKPIGRDLQSLDTEFSPYALSTRCGPMPFSESRFEDALTVLLRCATAKKLSQIAGSSLFARFECMQNAVLGNATTVVTTNLTKPALGLCDAQSGMFMEYGQCGAPMSIAFPYAFEGKACVEGPAFTCKDTFAQVLRRNCLCANPGSSFLINAECNELVLPLLLLTLGASFPLVIVIFFPIVLKFVVYSDEEWSTFVRAMRFRTERRSRDALLVNIALVVSVIFIGGVIGWLLSNPLQQFSKSIVDSDLFLLTPEVETGFGTFMITWSNCILFFLSLSASVMLVMSLQSYYLGRCVWTNHAPTVIRNGQWVTVPPDVSKVWSQLTFVTVNSIRLGILLVIGILALPALFYPFRFSATLVEPQFGSALTDRNFDVTANFSSIATSPEFMNAAVTIVGFSLMSSGLGFISCGVVYVFHGAAPGCFLAAQVMVMLMDRKEERDRQEYDRFRTLLPPPDNSELDRWRRIVFLFVWCTHATGAMGSSIAAILLYQTLRASPSYAIFWLLNWVVTLPVMFASTSKRYRSRHVFLGVAYCSLMGLFTGLMILFSPPLAGFTSWLACLLVVVIFAVVFLVVLSEFLNIADRFNTFETQRDQTSLLDSLQFNPQSNNGTAKSPKSPTTAKRMKSVVDSGPGDSRGTGLEVRNPLYEHERLKLSSGPSNNQAAQATKKEMSEHDMMRMMAAPSPSAPVRRQQAEAMAVAAEDLQRKINRLSMVQDWDENDIIATMQQADAQSAAATQSQSLQPRQQPQQSRRNTAMLEDVERERMRKRISKRLAARGVQGPAAKQLADRIAEYYAMKTVVERSKVAVDNNRVSRMYPLGSQAQMPQVVVQPTANGGFITNDPRLALAAAASPSTRKKSPADPAPMNSFERLPAVVSSSTIGRSPALPNQQQSGYGISSPLTLDTKGDANRLAMAAGKTRSPASPSSQNPTMVSSPPPITSAIRLNNEGHVQQQQQFGRSPYQQQHQPFSAFSSSSSPASPNSMQAVHQANAQATTKTGNTTMDDYFLRQFDPTRADELYRPFDGDDSFVGFLKEVGSQLFTMAKNRFVILSTYFKECCASSPKSGMEGEATFSSPGSIATMRKQMIDRARIKRQKQGGVRPRFMSEVEVGKGTTRFAFVYNRIRSRFARFLNERVRPIFARIINVLRESKENDDPATYGLRVPGRRLLFIQGLVLMFILLVYISRNRASVPRLKDSAIRFVLSQAQFDVDLDVAYNWPGVANLTDSLDVPLQSYVERATDTYNLIWLIFFLWLLSLVVEITYASFGRDMEEKRKGIKLARYISFLNLPLLLIAVVLPCAPDYVGLSLGGIDNVLPQCAPRLTATLLGVTSNLFGVLVGTYLSFQTMIVLLLIVPSVGRALFFVITREILDLQRLRVFEPRKAYTITRKRLQNARFVWRIFPLMSPVLTYLPLVLLCQIIGKLYVSIIAATFLVLPVVFAQFTLKKSAEDQSIRDWLIYSTVWIIYYVCSLSIIVLVESLERGQISFVLKVTFENWTWYLKIAAEVCLAIVVTSDILYQFMASDAELEADTVINDYFEALEEQAQQKAVVDRIKGYGEQGHNSSTAPLMSSNLSDGGMSTLGPLPSFSAMRRKMPDV